jgi:hypothetical protein
LGGGLGRGNEMDRLIGGRIGRKMMMTMMTSLGTRIGPSNQEKQERLFCYFLTIYRLV